jgi:tRNA (cmo5U34)-methyltransferase
MCPDSTSPIEGMAEFFDARVATYDDHMREIAEDFDGYYGAIAEALPATDAPVSILDLGIGTGLELALLFRRLPNARVTGIDLSAKMLAELRRKHEDRAGQIRTIRSSFLELDLGAGIYAHAVSSMALHHHLFDEKVALYRRIRRACLPGESSPTATTSSMRTKRPS